jgi:photosystem II oxygen-evolving enhancer protein 2
VEAGAAVCTERRTAAGAALPGNFYTLTTGANEKRWKKMKSKLEIVAKSFYNIN